MKKSDQSSHQLLIQKLLVSIHYLTLFKDEIILVEKTPPLLGHTIPVTLVSKELTEVLDAIAAMEKQERLIRSTFWYDEASFKLMNKSLDIVGTWVRGIDVVLETCQRMSVFQVILGDDRAHIFGVLADVYSSLNAVNLSIKEDSDEVLYFNPLVKNLQKPYVSKEELMVKIDAMLPEGEVVEEEEVKPIFEIADRDEVVKLFRHYLFDNGGNRVYVIDAKEDLAKEVNFYNAFARFNGVCDDMSTTLILLEEVMAEMEERSQHQSESDEKSFPPIYLVIYGQNILMKDSRFESLMSELTTLIEGTEIYILSYQAYL